MDVGLWMHRDEWVWSRWLTGKWVAVGGKERRKFGLQEVMRPIGVGSE